MAHFEITQRPDGSIERILKDGKPHATSLQLETPFAIVVSYFSAANLSLTSMRLSEKGEIGRLYGLQSFLMSLTGLEAFLNVFFHLKSCETGDDAIKNHATGDKSVESKLAGLPRRAFGRPLDGQKLINRKIRQLYDLRSSILHPKYEPVSANLSIGIKFEGLIENFQAVFNDQDFCQEALEWCLLAICRVGVLSDSKPNDLFCWRWTGLMLDDERLSSSLNVPRGQK